MIHQELQHIPALTVAQNLYLGRPLKAAGGLLVARRAQEARAREILADLDPTIDPARPIHELKVAQQQIVEIARRCSTRRRSSPWTSRPPRSLRPNSKASPH